VNVPSAARPTPPSTYVAVGKPVGGVSTVLSVSAGGVVVGFEVGSTDEGGRAKVATTDQFFS
jgi:hypothetical protein